MTPRGGGIAIVLAGVLCGFAVKMFYADFNLNLGWPIGLAVIAVAAMGFFDDHFGLSVRVRLLVGLVLAGAVGFGSLGEGHWILFGRNYEWPFELVILPVIVGLVWLRQNPAGGARRRRGHASTRRRTTVRCAEPDNRRIDRSVGRAGPAARVRVPEPQAGVRPGRGHATTPVPP